MHAQTHARTLQARTHFSQDVCTQGGSVLRMAVANSCCSGALASKLSEAVEFVIGHDGLLDDQYAVEFTRSLYGRLAAGVTLLDSYKQARSASPGGYRLRAKHTNPRKMIFLQTLVPLQSEICVNWPKDGRGLVRDEVRRSGLLKKMRGFLEGNAKVLYVTGSHRCGKSTLVRQFLKEAAKTGFGELRALLCGEDSLGNYKNLGAQLAQRRGETFRLPARTQGVALEDWVRTEVHTRLGEFEGEWLIVFDGIVGLEGFRGFPWSRGKTVVVKSADEKGDATGGGGGAGALEVLVQSELRADIEAVHALSRLDVGVMTAIEANFFIVSVMSEWEEDEECVQELAGKLGRSTSALRLALDFASKHKVASPREYLSLLEEHDPYAHAVRPRAKETGDSLPETKESTALLGDNLSVAPSIQLEEKKWSNTSNTITNTNTQSESLHYARALAVCLGRLDANAVMILRMLAFCGQCPVEIELFRDECCQRKRLDDLFSLSLVSFSGSKVFSSPHIQAAVLHHNFLTGVDEAQTVLHLLTLIKYHVDKVDIHEQSSYITAIRFVPAAQHVLRRLQARPNGLSALGWDSFNLAADVCLKLSKFLKAVWCDFEGAIELLEGCCAGWMHLAQKNREGEVIIPSRTVKVRLFPLYWSFHQAVSVM